MTVWDEPPFVPKRGHRSSPHIVDTPRMAEIHAFPPEPRSADAQRQGRTRQKRLPLCGFTWSPRSVLAGSLQPPRSGVWGTPPPRPGNVS